MVGDPVPAAGVEAEKGSAWARGSFENLLDLRGQAGEIVLPCVRHLLFLRIIAGFVRKIEGEDVPGEGFTELDVERGLLRAEAWRKKAVAQHELVGVDAWVAGIEQTGALRLDGKRVEQIFAEGVEMLVLIGGENKLRGCGGVTQLVEHLFGVGAVELLGDSIER